MKNVDEKILEIINKAEKESEKKDICDGVIKINNKYYEFEEQEFFDNKLKIYIPKEFKDMPLNERKIKYPSGDRPDIIKSNLEGDIAITLKNIDSPLYEENVEELKEGMKAIIKKTNPSNVFYEDGVKKVEEKNIGYFEFKGSAIDDFIYNFMFFFELEEKTIMGTFSCRYKSYKEWREVAFQIIETIKVIKES